MGTRRSEVIAEAVPGIKDFLDPGLPISHAGYSRKFTYCRGSSIFIPLMC